MILSLILFSILTGLITIAVFVQFADRNDAVGFMAWLFLVSLLLILGALTCARNPTTKKPAEISDIDRLRLMEVYYTNNMPVDVNGFIMVDKCDSLLFTSLANLSANLDAAEYTPGQYMRRPVEYPDCYLTNSSRSGVSRDMLLGVTYQAYMTGDLDRLLRLWDYGVKNNWVMAKHGGQHAIYSPADIALLAQIIFVLSEGEHDYAARHASVPLTYSKLGYVQHLQAITIWLRGEVYGGLLKSEIDLITRYANENPSNPLYYVVLQDYAKALKLIVNKWPADRLPTTADWCEPWPIQRVDPDKSLQPCPKEDSIHSGGELLFLARHIK